MSPRHRLNLVQNIASPAFVVKPSSNGASPLREMLSEACEAGGLSMKDLTVLSPQNDPYRMDTAPGHRDGKWAAEQIARFVVGYGHQVHLRGLHYLIASAGDVLKPDGTLYINDDQNWDWLSTSAAKAARWLGYVPFDRIRDERNAEAQLFIPEYHDPDPGLFRGTKVELPEIAEDLMPRFHAFFSARQAFRIALIAEKASVTPVLRPVAERIGGELLAMTGELSDTRICKLAKRAADDGRPCVVLYFSDHDPSGWQMPISVSRKIQALRDLLYPDLDIQVRRAALTAEQANALGLPTTPLKETERRAANWKAMTGREQTELDALLALHPAALRQFALEAIAPFFDETLAQRCYDAAIEWHAQAKATLTSHPEYAAYAERLEDARQALQGAAGACNELMQDALDVLSSVKPPEVSVPEPQLPEEASAEPLFTTADDFVAATLRLKQQKALIP